MRIPERWVALTVLCATVGAAAYSGAGAIAFTGKTFAGFLPFVDASLSNVDQPAWSGPRAGLRYLDHVLKADGVVVKTGADVHAAAARAAGKPVLYEVRRGERVFTVEVKPDVFHAGRLISVFLPVWLMGCFLGALAVIVAWLKPKAPFAAPFTLLCGLGSLIFFGVVIGTTRSKASWVFGVGFYLLPAAMVHLGLTFPEVRGKARGSRGLAIGAWVAAAAVTAVYLATLGTENDPTWVLHKVTLWMLAAGSGGLIINSLYTVLRSDSDLARTRARLLAIGMGGPLFTLVALAVAAQKQLVVPLNVAAAPLLLFPVAMGLGIARNDLFEVDVFVRRGARLLLSAVVLASSYLIIERALRTVLRGQLVENSLNLLSLAIAGIFILASERLRGGMAWLVERTLYPRAQQLRATLERSRDLFATASSASEVAAVMLSEVCSALDIQDAALFAVKGDQYQLLRGVGRWETMPAMSREHAVPKGLLLRGRRIGVEELREMLRLSSRKLGARAEGVRTLVAWFDQMGARLALRLMLRQEMLGILVVGAKRGREPFTVLDDQFLGEIASVAALALDDAMAYDEIAQLNRDLEKRVADRTRELHQANEELTRATRFKSEFIRSVSHELRTPLNAILGFTTLVRDREKALSPQSAEELAKVQRGAQALLLLIEDLLDLGRIEAGRFTTRLAVTDLAAVARDASSAVEPMARAKGLKLDVAVAGLPLVETDAARVRQILVNLLGNAVKFTPGGLVALRAEVVPDFIELQVWDTGPGIPQSEADSIFGEFVQLEQGDARQHQGSGLGLAISRKLARLLGGDVSLRDVQGPGSCFVLRLPRTKGVEVPDKLTTPPPTKVPARRRVVAVSEDPETIVRLRELLGQGGFDVAVAFDLDEAVGKVREAAPFAVALDGAKTDPIEARKALLAALGELSPPSVVLPVPLDRDRLFEALDGVGTR